MRRLHARAEILGFPTHAHYRMADTMAKDPNKAMDLMMKVWPAAVARVKEEVADMQAIANADNIIIEPWDYRFYAEKVRKAVAKLDHWLGCEVFTGLVAANRLGGDG